MVLGTLRIESWDQDEQMFIDEFISEMGLLAWEARKQIGLQEKENSSGTEKVLKNEKQVENKTTKSQIVEMKFHSGIEKVKLKQKFNFNGKERSHQNLSMNETFLEIIKDINRDSTNSEEALKVFLDSQSEKRKFTVYDTLENMTKKYKTGTEKNKVRAYLNVFDLIKIKGQEFSLTNEWNRHDFKVFLEDLEKSFNDVWKRVSVVKK